MTDRSIILPLYHQLLVDRWKKGRLLPEDVQAIQVFCEVHQITIEEHRQALTEVGLNARELMDEHGHSFEEWLESRRQILPVGSGALRYQSEPDKNLWQKKIALPTPWQTSLAILAGILFLAAIIFILFQLF